VVCYLFHFRLVKVPPKKTRKFQARNSSELGTTNALANQRCYRIAEIAALLFGAIDLLLRPIALGSFRCAGQSIAIAAAYRRAALMRAAVSVS
jgi:hypothetical protein